MYDYQPPVKRHRNNAENFYGTFQLSNNDRLIAAEGFISAYRHDINQLDSKNLSKLSDCFLVYYLNGEYRYCPINFALLCSIFPKMMLLTLGTKSVIVLPKEIDGYIIDVLLQYAHGKTEVCIFQDINFIQQLLIAAVYFDFRELVTKLMNLCPNLDYQMASEEAGKLAPPCLRDDFPAEEDHVPIQKDYLQGL